MKVLVTGVFDVIHQEHIHFLEQAKALGGRLIVALETDVRVRKIKGEGRPIHAEKVRQKNVRDLKIADEVILLPEDFDTPEARMNFLHKIKPDVLAVSSHTPHIEKKIRSMHEIGGRVEVVHKHNPAISSSILIEQGRMSEGN